jgi:hypothetical protein
MSATCDGAVCAGNHHHSSRSRHGKKRKSNGAGNSSNNGSSSDLRMRGKTGKPQNAYCRSKSKDLDRKKRKIFLRRSKHHNSKHLKTYSGGFASVGAELKVAPTQSISLAKAQHSSFAAWVVRSWAAKMASWGPESVMSSTPHRRGIVVVAVMAVLWEVLQVYTTPHSFSGSASGNVRSTAVRSSPSSPSLVPAGAAAGAAVRVASPSLSTGITAARSTHTRLQLEAAYPHPQRGC